MEGNEGNESNPPNNFTQILIPNEINHNLDEKQLQAQLDTDYDERLERMEKKMAKKGRQDLKKKMEIKEEMKKKEEEKYLRVLEELEKHNKNQTNKEIIERESFSDQK